MAQVEQEEPFPRSSLEVAGSPTPSTSSAIVADRPRKNVVVLKTRVEGPFGSEQTIYLCGTSHVSKKSCEDVKELIQAVKPQVHLLHCDKIYCDLAYSNSPGPRRITIFQSLDVRALM